jgi:hypothetical protein
MRNRINSALLLTMALLLSSCGGGGATSGDPLGTDSIKVEASVTSVGAGQESVITATVERQNKLPATDRSVSFTFRTNNTGGTLRVMNDQVDGQGKAVAVYTAGSNSPLNDVQDTIQASLSNDAAAAVVITRSAGTAPTASGYTVTLTADPSSFTCAGGGCYSTVSSILTASVKDASSATVSGMTVTFSIVSGLGTLSSATAVTDASGKAVVGYTSRDLTTEAGTIIYIILKAKLPDGTETMITMQISA